LVSQGGNVPNVREAPNVGKGVRSDFDSVVLEIREELVDCVGVEI
jgi:hypothetical protein